ncbi:MAG: helix-hairpin-helix domain-containing protein [Acidobacteriota bacterium]
MNISALIRSSRIWRGALPTLALALFIIGNWPPSSASQGRPMPDGPGKAETQKFCSMCHDLDKSLSMKQDRAGWRTTVDKMVAAGMKASEAEVNTIIDYLYRSYPADDVPRLKVNEAEALDFESILSLKRSQANAVIKYRETHGKFKSIEDLKKVPGLDAAMLEAKKDRLIFE